jgi:hypothetical protein
MLNVRWRAVRRGDVKAILLLAAILVVVAVAVAEFPASWTNFFWTWGLGRDWECPPTYGGPVCVKKPVQKSEVFR